MNVVEGDVTLGDMMAVLWRGKWRILGCVAACLIVALLLVAVATPHYRAQMIVAPARSMQIAQVASPVAGDEHRSALRAIMNAGMENSADFLRFEHIIDGQAVAEELLKDEALLKGLEGDEWNAAKLADYTGRRVRVEQIGDSALRRIIYYHPDAEFSATFLGALHKAADRSIRESIRKEAEGRIEYLRGAMMQAAHPDHRRAFTDLLLEQERLKMLASVDQPYAAIVVEPPASSFKPAWPDKKLALAAAAALGFLMGIAAAGMQARD